MQFKALGEEPKEKTPEQLAKEAALAEQKRIADAIDAKNAAGAAKELKKSEMVDWRSHPALNKVTKMSISYFESKFSYDDYIEEKNEKESNMKGSKTGGSANKDSSSKAASTVGDSGGSDIDDDDDEEEDETVLNWNRAEAERIYASTRLTLEGIY